jgi:hypothetical protein
LIFKFYSRFIFLTIVVSYFRSRRFINAKIHDLIIIINSGKYPYNIQDQVLTTGTTSKGKFIRLPPISDEIIEDLREMVEKNP